MVTTPKAEADYPATGNGIVSLKGRSTLERALAIISLAHPKFRDGLMRESEHMYLL
jgi:itaconate CoA-transferase